jgi:hypothetical protein
VSLVACFLIRPDGRLNRGIGREERKIRGKRRGTGFAFRCDRVRGGHGQISGITKGRRVSSADGEYRRSDKDRMLQARNGMVFIQAWIDLQLKRERRRDIKRWLESKKGRVERQLEMLDRRVQQ